MNWQPSAPLSQLRFRAALMQRIRQFFVERGYWEVETPILSRYGITDVYIEQVIANCMGQQCYLQTSPEYPMKRLLAAGSGPIFQLARVFRDQEKGRWHQPEFTLLEWYQLDCDHHGLMDEMDVFLQAMLGCAPMTRRTYQEVFETYVGINPHEAPLESLQHSLQVHQLTGILPETEQDRDQYLFLLMSHVVERELAKASSPTAVYGFPPSQAALARIEQNVAARFEVYYQGIELANGFFELQDTTEQAARFLADQTHRQQRGLPAVEIDAYFLAALSAGLPMCSGVALGVDRLIALASQATHLREVLAFEFEETYYGAIAAPDVSSAGSWSPSKES